MQKIVISKEKMRILMLMRLWEQCLKFGSEAAKHFYQFYMMDPLYSHAHSCGDIHIHDLDFYGLTTTCTQIDLIRLFKDGFSTGHGFMREPNSITSYSALACIAIQSNQNDQHEEASLLQTLIMQWLKVSKNHIINGTIKI